MKKEFDLKLNQEKRMFLYMPLMHSELLLDQELSVELYNNNDLTGRIFSMTNQEHPDRHFP